MVLEHKVAYKTYRTKVWFPFCLNLAVIEYFEHLSSGKKSNADVRCTADTPGGKLSHTYGQTVGKKNGRRS